MSSVQKVIKYFAIAFAVFLIFNIVSGVIIGINALSNIFASDSKHTNKVSEFKINNDYKVLDIEVASVNIVIKEGSKLKVETDSSEVRIKEVGNKLLVVESEKGLFKKKSNEEVIVYIPDDYIFDEVSMETGAGRVDIDSLNTKELELELGAGKVVFDKLNVSYESSIDSGAGEVIINNGNVNNLDLDIGIGKVELNLSITGNSEIDAGVGEVDLNLLNSSDDYKIRVNKGIGSIKIAGDEMSDGSYYGDGNNIINIDGGVGNINIDFEN